jgi:hypothetical protein
MSSTALEFLRAAASKIDETPLKANNDSLTSVAKCKIVRAIDEHGAGGVVAFKVYPNWTEGATPLEFPTGFKAVFDANKAQVVPAVISARTLYAGTMAYRVPSELLTGSKLSEDGVSVHPSEIVKSLKDAVSVSNKGLEDSGVGIFEHKKRGDSKYTHEYWVVARGVDVDANAQLETEIAKHAGQSYATMLAATAAHRQAAFVAQRAKRADQISEALGAVGIEHSGDKILKSGQYIDNVCNSLVDDPQRAQATLYSEVVALQEKTASNGVVLVENMRLGPVLLRSAGAAASKTDAFPATTGIAVPLWVANLTAGALKFDNNSKKSSTNACTWDSTSAESHPLLATNAYRSRSAPAWRQLEAEAGFSPSASIALIPIAVKLAPPIEF